MKLTVGPLPPAVYWRRRGGVLGALLVVVLIGLYSCSGSSDQAKTTAASPASAGPAGGKPLTPTVQGSPVPTVTTATSSAAPVLPALTGPCADSEIALTASSEQATVGPGAPVKLILKIKNLSSRTCDRDVGPDPQEIFIQSNGVKLWSSDSCGALHGSDVRTFAPVQEIQFFVVWNGTAKATNCSETRAYTGTYQVVGRLGNKLSDPGSLTVAPVGS